MAESEMGRSAMLGDWLLIDEALEPPGRPSGRSGPWRPLFRGGGHVLYGADPGPFWVGAPWRSFTWDGGRAWLWGESSADDRTLERVARGGDASVLGGRFLLVVFLEIADSEGGRSEGGRFEVVTDRFATLHAYALDAAGSGARRVVSSSFAAASAYSSRQLDWQALTSFFAAGFFLGECTFWRDLRFLAPARRHVVASVEAGSKRYWNWRFDPIERTREQTVDAFAEVFEEVVADACRTDAGRIGTGRVALPLSGGLDSRALAAAAPPGGVAWSFGYGYQPDSVEIRLARRIAARRRLPFDSLVVEPYLPDQVDRVFELVEGFQDVTQTRQVAVADLLRERAELVLAGHWGDVWLDDMGTTGSMDQAAYDARLSAHAVAKLEKRGGAWLLDKLCRPRVGGEELFEQQVAEALGEYRHLGEVDFQLKAFKTDHWSSRWTLASVRAYQAAAFPRLPFYDPRLADFFATVPAASLRDRRLEIDYLRRRAGDLARIPWQETGAGLHRSRRAARWLGLPRRAFARALRTVRGRRVLERNWEVQLLGPSGRRLLEDRLMRRGLRLHDLVDPREVRALLEDFHAGPTAASGYTVSMLLTFSLFLERH